MQESPVVQKLEKALSASGFDICVPFQLQRYNDVAPGKARVPCSRFSAGGAALAILFGNSKAMWDFFLAACTKDEKLVEGPNPLDTYVKGAVLEALETAAPGQSVKIYWGNDQHDDLEGGKGYVAIQALAAGLGLCYLDKGSHLCVNPVYGPWFSLRGFMVLEGLSYQPPDTAQQYEPLPNPLTKEQQDRVAAAMQEALKPADEQSAGGATYTGVREQWRKWLEVRTSLTYPEQHPWQYDEQQIVYHYTGNRDVLRSCVKEALRSKEEQPSGL